MMRKTAFLARITKAAQARQSAEQRRVTNHEQALLQRQQRREKLQHDAWKVREAAWDTLYAVAQVLGGMAVVNRGGCAIELQGVAVPVRFDIEPGTNGVAITAQWAGHEVERSFGAITAAGKFVEECVEAAVRGTGPAPARKPPSAE